MDHGSPKKPAPSRGARNERTPELRGKAARGRPRAPRREHLPWGKAFHVRHRGRGCPARRVRGQTPHAPRAGRSPESPPVPGSGLVGPARPPVPSLFPRRNRGGGGGAPSQRPRPTINSPPLVPGRSKVTPSVANQPAVKAAGTHTIPALTCHPATTARPQPPGCLILPREAGH